MSPQEQFNQAIEPILELCRIRSGFKSELRRQLALLGEDVHKQSLTRWLHPDPAKRTQPSFGMGLMLMQAATLAERKLVREAARDLGRFGIGFPRAKKPQSVTPPAPEKSPITDPRAD